MVAFLAPVRSTATATAEADVQAECTAAFRDFQCRPRWLGLGAKQPLHNEADIVGRLLNRHRSNWLQSLQKPVRFHCRRLGTAIGDHLFDIFLGDVAKTVRGLEGGGQLFTPPLGCVIEALGDFCRNSSRFLLADAKPISG